MKMQIGRWGNSLAVRLPRELVERLDLREGDALDLAVVENALVQARDVAKEQRRQAALEKLRKGRYTLPPDWKLTREEMNWRPAFDKW